MPPQNNDVKQEAASSALKEDVKPTFESTAEAMVEALVSGSSPESEKEESGDVLKKNSTDEDAPVEGAEATVDENEQKDEQVEQKDEEKVEEVKEQEETTDEDETAKEEKDDKSDKSKHEEAVPYERFKEVNEKAQRYEGLAKDQENLVAYCQQKGISSETFQNTLEILGLMQTDPKAALAKLTPIVDFLKVSSEQGLPADLQKEVEEGTLSEARAKELAKLRVQHSSLEHQNRFSLMQQQQNEQKQLMDSLASWANAKKQLDPGFKPKANPTDPDGKFEDFLAKNVFMWTQNPPKNVAEAVALADRALAEVNAMAKRYAPKPKAIKAPPKTISRRSSESEKPKSMDDVATQIGRKHGFAV